MLEAPKAWLEAAEAWLEAPEALLKAPGARLEAPEAWLEVIEARLEAPKAWLEAPEAWLETPVAWLEAPEAWLGGTYVRTDVRTKFPYSIGHRSLRGRYPKSIESSKIDDEINTVRNRERARVGVLWRVVVG